MNAMTYRFLVLAAFCLSASAFAGPTDDAKALMAKGQYQDALKQLDQQVAHNPQDAQARFERGIALTKLKRTTDAMKVFSDLTRDYPQLPEPYNNLAVLYAQQGDYDKARQALEAALAIHPGYATAHENLGDIYAALAAAAYNRALTLDKGNQEVRNKLNLINQAEHSTDSGAVAATPAPQSASPAPAAPAPTPVAAVAAATTSSGAAVDADTKASIDAVLQAWAKAWSSKDLTSYFAAYGTDFTPEGALSRAAWTQQRKERISKPSHITVTVNNVTLARTSADRVSVDFTQNYESDSFSDSVDKILDMQRGTDGWKIVREYTR
ncbi:MAG: tetratricopeptide repeat protein [Stenotrophobium sp.]